MSDKCSVPRALRSLIHDLEEMCALLAAECVEHDHSFYDGGTLALFHVANQRLYNAILPKLMNRYGAQHGEAWATLWYGAVNLGWSHWGSGRTWDGRTLWAEAGTESP